MKIHDSSIRFSSEHRWTQKAENEERFNLWIGDPPGAGETNRTQADPTVRPIANRIKISPEARKVSRSRESEEEAPGIDQDFSLKILIVEKMVKLLTGREVKITRPMLPGSREAAPDLPVEQTVSPSAGAGPDREGWGLEYSRVETYAEAEHLGFRVQGVVTTTDDREIRFTGDFQLERRFFTRDTFSLRAGDAVKTDPLVINWDGLGVRLTEARTPFDLNSDGNLESIPGVLPGSGFLVLDLNRDGLINDGRELFGPRTGNGFAELARYDQDGSAWIDEADPMFSQLRIWTKSPEGTDILRSLDDQRIGAIYLDSAGSPFQLKSTANESLGEVVRSGVYLEEDGQAGLIQQINLTA